MNRRDFLKTLGIGAGTALLADHVIEALAAPDLPAPLRTPADADSRDQTWHALNRLTFGPRPGQVDAVNKMGLQAYIEQQLNYQSIDDSAVEQKLGNYITLDMSVPELIALDSVGQQPILELDSATIIRSAESNRELYEVMVNFWSEHFSIWHLKEQCKILKTVDDREVVRKYAFGKFRDLLGASAKSPAMLIYLDNAKSNKAHPNENYAREVMELHTITIGNYTEQDVKEVARCFTGWSLERLQDPDPGEFVFRPGIHDNGSKTVLGHQIPAGGGIQDGETVLDILASHPATAKHIASKLCRRFIADDPPDNVVQAAAATFLSSGGDIPSVLRTIFAAPEFMSAPPKYKRPYEYIISLFRAFNADLAPIDEANSGDSTGVKANPNIGKIPLALLKGLGQLPFDHITPDGYTDYASLWETNMLLRWNAAILAVYGVLPGVKIDVKGIIAQQNVDVTPHGILDYFAQHLFGRLLTPQELDTLWTYMSPNGGTPTIDTDAGRKLLGDAIAMMAAAPAFQFR